VHEAGLKVQTTLDLDLQQTANRAVADGLATYERRKGWTGKLENVVSEGTSLTDYKHPDWAVKSKPGDYVHAWLPAICRLRSKPAWAMSRLCSCPKIGNGPVSTRAANWSSPATLFMST
jgi:membrane carboxypeptidase/penicillin-binding protein